MSHSFGPQWLLSLPVLLLAVGCGQHRLTCDCNDATTQKETAAGHACDRCEALCSAHGGWKGSYAYPDEPKEDGGPFDLAECNHPSLSGTGSIGGSGSGSGAGSTAGSGSGGSSGGSGSTGSGSTGGSASVQGLPGFSVGDVGGAAFAAPDGGADLRYVEIDLTSANHGGLCATGGKPRLAPGEVVLTIGVDGPGQPVTPGTYRVGQGTPADGGGGTVSESVGLPDGGASAGRITLSGSVTLTTVSVSGTAGHFEALLAADGGHDTVQGTFDSVPLCGRI